MTTTFKGYATTSTLIEMDSTVAVAMPTGVTAGDYLVAMIPGNIHQTALDPSVSATPAGWVQVPGNNFNYTFYKIANGSESGGTVDFRTFPSFPSPWAEPGPRVFLGVVLLYDFSTPPGSIYSVEQPPRNFSSSPNTFTDAVSGVYGDFVGGEVETRVYGFIGAGNDEDFNAFPIEGYTWTNATDRSGVISHARGGGILDDTQSLITADTLDIPAGDSSQRVNLTLEGSGFYGVGGDIFGVRFTFPELPPVDCIRHNFGYNTTADAGFAYLGTNDETGGYSRAGGNLSVYPVGPLTEVSSIDGALIIATVHRFAWDSSTPPPRGTLSGFGATWDLIDYQEAVGNDGAAFVEIYRTMQLDYGPFPDYAYPGEPPNEGIGYLEYSFPPNDNQFFTSVGWMSYKGADAAGYADNGASAIRNFTSHPVTTETSARTMTHTAPTRDTNSILWFSSWDLLWGGVEGTSPSGNWSAVRLAEASQILDITPFNDDFYGSGNVHFEPPPAFSSDPVREWASGGSVLQFPSFVNTWHYYWPPGDVYVIWGKSLEILIDPNVLCPEDVAYWGILAVPL